MKANVYFVPAEADEDLLSGKNAIVIDVLRATTTIVTALNNGAKEVVPVNTRQMAMSEASDRGAERVITGGERETVKIEGFDFGNSPLDYSHEVVNGKSLILFTTNGTKALVKARLAKNLLACSLLNVSAIAEYLIKLDEDFEIICSGGNGCFCLEDTFCAGKIIEHVLNTDKNLQLTDSAKASLLVVKETGSNILKLLSECDHGKKLINHGFGKDIEFCSNLNAVNLVPAFLNNTIKSLSEETNTSC